VKKKDQDKQFRKVLAQKLEEFNESNFKIIDLLIIIEERKNSLENV